MNNINNNKGNKENITNKECIRYKDSINTKMPDVENHGFTSFLETRKYLQRVNDCKNRIELLEKRNGYHSLAKLDANNIKTEIDVTQHKAHGECP